MAEERLQKILAHAGIASRRKAEELILEGRVKVNGKVITEPGAKAELGRDHIRVDGKLLRAAERLVYLALNKPRDYVTTVTDPQGRPTVMDLVRVKERVYPVGRLDYHSEGLLLLTNDGEFANRITSAANHVTKTYVVKVNGPLTPEQEEQFRKGVPLGGRRTAPAGLKRIREQTNPWYEVQLIEGRQNQIRLMFKHFGRLVEKLRRVKIGFLALDLKPGELRPLTPQEVAKFRKLLKIDADPAKA
jgi:23S rRNA pseudouridine2605 synthase